MEIRVGDYKFSISEELIFDFTLVLQDRVSFPIKTNHILTMISYRLQDLLENDMNDDLPEFYEPLNNNWSNWFGKESLDLLALLLELKQDGKI